MKTAKEWLRLIGGTGQFHAPDCRCERCKNGKETFLLESDIKEIMDNAAAECHRCADNDRWMREVLTDFKIPFDDHKIGRRLAFTQWMADVKAAIDARKE